MVNAANDEQNCGTCCFGIKSPNNQPGIMCRRFPPQSVAMPVQTLQGTVFAAQPMFPVLAATQVCGEWKALAKLTLAS